MVTVSPEKNHLEQICFEHVTSFMGLEGTPTELWSCCRTYFTCRCQNQMCKQKKSWLKYCNTCKFNMDICDAQICNRWDNKSASFADMGLVIAAIIDILLTVFLVAAICMIEIKKRRPGNLPTDSASDLSKSVQINLKEIAVKNIQNSLTKSQKSQPKFSIKSPKKKSPRIMIESTNLIKKSQKTLKKSPKTIHKLSENAKSNGKEFAKSPKH